MKKNKSNKAIIISAAIILFIILTVIFVAFGIPTINAKLQMRETSNGFGEISDGDIIVLSDPMQSGIVVAPDTTKVFDGERAADVAGKVFELTEGAKYKKTRKAIAGSWDINISLRTSRDNYIIYFEEDGFYVTESVREYFFEPSREMKEKYVEFYEEITDLLDQKHT